LEIAATLQRDTKQAVASQTTRSPDNTAGQLRPHFSTAGGIGAYTMERKTITLLSIGISAALVAAAIWFLFNHYTFMWGAAGRWSMPHAGYMGGGGMGLLMFLFWGVVILAFVLIVSAAFTGRKSSGQELSAGTSAREILNRRYARGEIDRDQFETMRRDIEKTGGNP
jgi:putative membrane protein